MRQIENKSLPLLNSAVAFVVLIPILLIAISVVRENIGLRTALGDSGEGKPHDQPPIIVLRESEGYSFPSGSAALSPAFQRNLKDEIIPTLARNIETYRCDIVEVIGHTDSQPVAALSNIDTDFLAFVRGTDIALSPGSNADLGLMRAWNVINFLVGNGKWERVRFYGYSAAQAIAPSGELVKVDAPVVDAQRRRIEVRVRRSK